MKKAKANLSLALLRASRDVWPEGDVFGEQDAEPEDEFMTLREILFADIKKPDGFADEEGTEKEVST